MRRGREGSVWRDEVTGKAVALNLGADFCAEHEWGIEGINRMLGIDKPEEIDLRSTSLDAILEFLRIKSPAKLGIAARTMSSDYVPIHNLDSKGVVVVSGFGKGKKSHTLWSFSIVSEWTKNHFDFSNVRENYYSPEREELVGHWSENDACVFIEDRSVVEDFIEAFKKKDITVWLGGGGVFQNSGLVIAIASRLPEDFKKNSIDSDLDQFNLTKAAASTGIHKTIENANLSYYALSPRWKDESKKEVSFWLNPRDQHKYNSCWCSVDDLILWTKGKGKIVKKAEN